MNEDAVAAQFDEVAQGLGLGVVPKPAAVIDDRIVDGNLRLPDATMLPYALRMQGRWEAPPGYFRDVEGPVVVVQTYINPRLAERYQARRQFYVDLAGNAWIWMDGYRVLVEGRRFRGSEPRLASGGLLRTVSELRVAFLLLAGLPVGSGTVRDVAAAAGMSVGSAHAALASLRTWGFLAEGFGVRREQELLDLWLAGFSARLLPSLRSRVSQGASPDELVRLIDDGELVMVPAGEAVAPVMSSRGSVVLYGCPPWVEATRAGRLHPDPEGTITLREAFWSSAVTVPRGGKAEGILTCAELLASYDERLRGAGAEMRESLR